MIYFGIPLRSKAASNDWKNVERVFNRTLHSVYSQTNPNFRIIVACHDKPELKQVYDDRVEFIISDQPTPTNRQEMMLDKGWKVQLIGNRIRAYGGGYTMMVDSDDLISNQIAEYAEQHPDETGFLSTYGYVYNDGFPYVKKMLALHRTCGSCSIVNYSVEDLPDCMPENLWSEDLGGDWIMRNSHRYIPEILKQKGRELNNLPFPSTIYVRKTGDNHSMLSGGDLNWKRKLELSVRPKIRIEEIAEEFGILET